MSSTNRGKNERAVSDYYVTPPQAVKDFLQEWRKDEDYPLLRNKMFLDPCAGGDEHHDMTYPKIIKEIVETDNIRTIDIRPDSKAEISCDYLQHELQYKPDIIISNPPFFLAQEFITKALHDVQEGGYIIMLLRLNFLESKARKQFFENNMPERIYVHHKRMSFTDDGKTDSVAYCHMVFKKGRQLTESKLKII